MKDNINFYYNFNVSTVENWGDVYKFWYNNNLFYLAPYNYSPRELKNIVEVSTELKQRGIEAHDIILNRYGKIITNLYNQNYVLVHPIKEEDTEYDLKDIIMINNYLELKNDKKAQYKNNWADLWSHKLDYFEYQVHELGKNKNIVVSSFSYYLGLGENAISYVNNANRNYQITSGDKICLSHRRINYPNYKVNFLNPFNFIFDLEVRDIASFIKSAFFAGEDALSFLKEVLKLKTFTTYSLEMLYGRLLYPTYYFDIYEDIMNDKKDEEKLIPIIDRANDYEEFLKNAYYEICKYRPISRIEWLLKDK